MKKKREAFWIRHYMTYEKREHRWSQLPKKPVRDRDLEDLGWAAVEFRRGVLSDAKFYPSGRRHIDGLEKVGRRWATKKLHTERPPTDGARQPHQIKDILRWIEEENKKCTD